MELTSVKALCCVCSVCSLITDYGRPWRTHEAFQFILKEQVKALIRLGAKAELTVCITCKISS